MNTSEPELNQNLADELVSSAESAFVCKRCFVSGKTMQ